MRGVLQRLPVAVRHPLMRRFVRLDLDRINAIEVRYAQTADEYRKAFGVLFEAYNDVGFFDGGNNPRARAARHLFYAQAALPTSTVIIALDGDQVVGTTTVIRDSAMGLAADPLLGARKHELIAHGERFCEVSMLAVAQSHRRGPDVLFAILRYIAILFMDRERGDLAAVTTNAVLADALHGLILFQPVTKTFVHPKSGARTMGLVLDFRDIDERGRKAYRNAPRHRDLPRFFLDEGRARIRFPTTPWTTTLLPKLRPSDFATAFGSPADLHEGLSERDFLVLRNAFSPAMRRALPGWLPAGPVPDREPRFDGYLAATLRVDDGAQASVVGVVEQVSAHGAFITANAPLRVGQTVIVETMPAPDRACTVRGRVVHMQRGRQYGIALSATDDTWNEYVRFLEAWLWGSEIANAS